MWSVVGSKTYYDTLGVPATATSDEIRQAYRKLALKFHPDRNPGNSAAEATFKEINAAYQVLSDDGKKLAYDFDQRMHTASTSVHAQPGKVNTSVEDWAAEIFNVGDFNSFKTPRRHPSTQDVFQKEVPGDDILMDLELTLEESVTGCKKPINVKGPRPSVRCSNCNGIGSKPGGRKVTCTSCAGHGKNISANGRGVRNCQTCGGSGVLSLERCYECGGNGKITYIKEITVQVPAGIAADQQLRLAGQGTPGHPPGNLFITIRIAPNKLFWRDGNDLHTSKRVSFSHAIIGGDIVFVGPEGHDMNLRVPPGTQPGDLVRILGAGVIGTLSKVRGDLVVHIDVMLPRVLSPRARKLLDEFMAELSRGPQSQ